MPGCADSRHRPALRSDGHGPQQMPQLPTDKEVRIGKLPNGLTYYIRHNEYPKGQADFYIAQKVGSMQEEDHQAGLAHFLEHMCFNGTTHFPGKDLINYLESVGVKFGRNLNAMTGFDQTVYNISNVPVALPRACRTPACSYSTTGGQRPAAAPLRRSTPSAP